MARVDRLWLATLTKDTPNAGAASRSTTHASFSNVPIGMLINADGHDAFYDMARMQFNGDGLRRGHALVNAFTRTFTGSTFVNFSLETDRLTNSSTRLFNLSSDAWHPQSVFIWGDTGAAAGVAPIAMNLSMDVILSTEEGHSSTAIHRIDSGTNETLIERILVLTRTESGNAGTDGRVTLRITADNGNRVVDFELPQTPQQDLEANRSNFYTTVPERPFRMRELLDDSIRLTIDRADLWLPSGVFVFGIGDVNPNTGAFTSAVPILYTPDWNRPGLSTSSAGANSLTFSPADVPPPPEPNPAPDQGPLAPP